ncbi:MAG: DNA replication/repair protein RecF [Saprospiraceae bacterium]|nr:DNA replication/repair protein RecF [Saprospiraceae bacterium]
MIFKKILFAQFKNLNELSFNPKPGINFIIGNNGVGKTNILDGIHFCCMTKSYFHHSDKMSIQHDRDFFRIESLLTNDEEHQIIVRCKKNGQRVINFDSIAYSKASEHLGKIPVIMIIPDEVYTFINESEERRKFINYSLVQTDREYFYQLNLYNQQIKQRKSFLKSNNPLSFENNSLLDAYESDMYKAGRYIVKARSELIKKINPYLEEFSREMSDGQQSCSIRYKSNYDEEYALSEWAKQRESDALSGRTRTGIHLDKLECFFNNQSLKNFGSQGQIKTFVIALRFAQMKYLQSESHRNPILLLDDLFAKLDEDRVAQLVKLIERSPIDQCFITDTNLDRAKKIAKQINQRTSIHIFNSNQLQIHEKE